MGNSGTVDLNCSQWIWSWALQVSQRASCTAQGLWNFDIVDFACNRSYWLVCACQGVKVCSLCGKTFFCSVKYCKHFSARSLFYKHFLSVWLDSAECPGRHSVFVCKACLLLDWEVPTVGVNWAVLHSCISLSLPLVVILLITDALWSLPCFLVALPLLLLEVASYGNDSSEFPLFTSQKTVRVKAMSGVRKKGRG